MKIDYSEQRIMLLRKKISDVQIRDIISNHKSCENDNKINLNK